MLPCACRLDGLLLKVTYLLNVKYPNKNPANYFRLYSNQERSIPSLHSLFFVSIQACPFQFEVFTKDCDGEIEITGMAVSATPVEPALCQLVRDQGVHGTIKDAGEDVVTHTLITPAMTTIVVENKVRYTKRTEFHLNNNNHIE